MFKKSKSLVSMVTFLIFLVGQSGCSTIVTVRMDQVKSSDSQQRVMGSGTLKGEIRAVHTQQDTIRYDGNNAYIDSVNQAVVGYDDQHRYRSVPLSEVTGFEVKRFSKSKTVSGTLLVWTAVLGLAALAWSLNPSGPISE